MRKVPKLRFKEFSDEWEEKKLGEISEVKDGTHDSPKYIEVGFPLITSKNVKKGKVDLSEVNYISKEDYDSINRRSKVSKGDILMGMIGTIGNLAIVDKEDFAIKNVALIKEKKELKNIFLIQFLESDIFKKKISLSNEGGTQKFISLKNIRNFTFFIPQLQEQEKIANFLSSVDKKISLTEEKLELFKKYKKGVMQRIFSQKLRFKDGNGNNYPEWEEKKLGEIIKEHIEKTTINNQYSILSSTNKGIVLQNDYFNKQTASTNNIGYKIVPKDYFTYRSMSDTGEFTFNIQHILEKGIVSPAYPVFNTDSENKLFIYYSLNYNNFIKEQILTLKEGGTRYALSYKKLENLFIFLPVLEEQQKISDFLSSIDNKIENMEKELKGLKKFKKGLLQQMFI